MLLERSADPLQCVLFPSLTSVSDIKLEPRLVTVPTRTDMGTGQACSIYVMLFVVLMNCVVFLF